jgi:hypothetical protein
MKAIAILPAAAAAILTLCISVASSQEVCLKEYAACMDKCGAKPGPQMQDACFQNCQANNNQCSDRVFGGGAVVNVPQAAAAQGKDAMAKKEPRGRDSKKMQKKDAAPAPAAEQQQQDAAPAPAAEPEQAPAAH